MLGVEGGPSVSEPPCAHAASGWALAWRPTAIRFRLRQLSLVTSEPAGAIRLHGWRKGLDAYDGAALAPCQSEIAPGSVAVGVYN